MKVLATPGSAHKARPCASSVLAHQAPFGSGTCRQLCCTEKAGWGQWENVFMNMNQSVSKWLTCGNLPSPEGFVGPLGNSGQG